MITVSVEFKPVLPGSKVKARAEVGLLGVKGNVLDMLTYTEGVAYQTLEMRQWASMGELDEVLADELAEDLATGYLLAHAPEFATGELDDGTPHFGNAEIVYHKGTYLVLFDEAEEQTHAMYK